MKSIFKPYFRTCNGISYLEVMISVVILSIGIIGVTKLQTRIMQMNTDSSQRSEVVSVAQNKAEELMGLRFTDIDLIDANPGPNPTSYSEPNPPPGYTVKWQVNDVNANEKTVTVDVEWKPVNLRSEQPSVVKTYSVIFVKIRPS